MVQLLFKNRYFALVWVALTLFAAAAFVGDGGGREQIDAAAQRLQAQRQAIETPSDGHTFVAEDEDSEDPTPVVEPDNDDPQLMTGPNGERYRVLNEEEVARVNGEDTAEQKSAVDQGL